MSNNFREDCRRIGLRIQVQTRDVFTGVVMEMHRSIQEGSELTGSPGQPVDTGELRASWIANVSGDVGLISTKAEYAKYIEDGVVVVRRGQVTGSTKQRLTLRSKVGGFGSVAKTIAGLPRIVEHVTQRVAGGVK